MKIILLRNFYGRFSSNNQREESIDAQYRACKQFVEARGDTIVAKYYG